MTPTEMYKRAESLFNDRTKRELADMVVHREADLEDARTAARLMWQRLRWADEVLDGGIIDARMARAAKKLGVVE